MENIRKASKIITVLEGIAVAVIILLRFIAEIQF